MQTNLLLGSHYILIARAEYLVNLGYTLGTISHSTDGLNTTSLEYLANTRNASCYQNGRINLAVATWRRAEHNLLTACYLGRCGQHKHS